MTGITLNSEVVNFLAFNFLCFHHLKHMIIFFEEGECM